MLVVLVIALVWALVLVLAVALCVAARIGDADLSGTSEAPIVSRGAAG